MSNVPRTMFKYPLSADNFFIAKCIFISLDKFSRISVNSISFIIRAFILFLRRFSFFYCRKMKV